MLPVPGSGVVGGGGVVVLPPTYKDDPSASVNLILVGALVVVDCCLLRVVCCTVCTRFKPPLRSAYVSLCSEVPIRLRVEEEFSRLLEREGFCGALGLETSLIPKLERNDSQSETYKQNSFFIQKLIQVMKLNYLKDRIDNFCCRSIDVSN